MMSVYPVELKRVEQDVVIRWNDGKEQRVSVRALRKACPCATCRHKNMEPAEKTPNSLNILTPAQTLPLRIEQMVPVGQYAYNIQFSDGHNTGIFTFDQLRTIADHPTD